MGLIVIAAAVLRVWMLDAPVSYDEAFTYVRFAALSLYDAVSTYSFPNNHLFHTVLVWPSVRVFGINTTALRLPVLLSGIAIVPLLYALGRMVSGRVAGLVAAALAAGAFELCAFSVNARGYMLQAALFYTAMCLGPAVVRSGGWRSILGCALLLALAFFTVPTMVFGAGTLFVWGLALAWKERPEARWSAIKRLLGVAGIGAVLTLLLYAPALNYLRTNVLRKMDGTPYGDLIDFFVRVGGYLVSDLPDGLAWFCAAGLVASVVADVAARRVPLAFQWLSWPVLAVALHHAFSKKAPFDRNFLILLPLVFVLVGHGVAWLLARLREAQHWAGPALAIALLGWGGWRSVERHPEAHLNPARNSRLSYEALREVWKPGDYVMLNGAAYVCLEFYARGDGIRVETGRNRLWELHVARRGVPGETKLERMREGRPFTRKGSQAYLIAQKPGERALATRWLTRHSGGAPYRWESLHRWDGQDDSRAELLRVHPTGPLLRRKPPRRGAKRR